MRSQCIGSRNEDPFACWELDKQRQTCCQAFLPFPWDLGSKFSPFEFQVPSPKPATPWPDGMTQLGGFGPPRSLVLAIMKWHFEMAAAAGGAAVSMSWTTALHFASCALHCLFIEGSRCRVTMPLSQCSLAWPLACGLSPLARNVSASYTFYKDIKYEIYGMCDCDTPCIWAAGETKPIDTMPSNALSLLLLFVVDSPAYRSVNN